MKKSHWLSLIAILLAAMLVIPVSAESVYTRFENGSTLVGNGSYWTLWEPVGNHTVGDRFFVNGTTNLPVGTVLQYEFVRWEYTNRNPGTLGDFSIDQGTTADSNTFSFIVNTTGLREDNYFLTFYVCPVYTCPSNNKDAAQALSPSYIVDTNFTRLVANPHQIAIPTSVSLSVIPVCGALFLSLCVVHLIRKKKQRCRFR
jgi:hypothetical protein